MAGEFVVLGLGSNRKNDGLDCVGLLGEAVRELAPSFSRFCCSSIYRTKPMYVEAQDDFFNMAMCGVLRERWEPLRFLGEIHRIEALLGRNRAAEIRNGPRSLDIDIEYFGGMKISEPDLTVPHPRVHERAFVLVPACEALSAFGGQDALIEEYSAFLGRIGACGVEKFMDSRDFQNSRARV